MKVAGRSTRRVAVPQPPMSHVSAGGLAWRPEYSCPSFPLSTVPRLIQTALTWVRGAPWGVPTHRPSPAGPALPTLASDAPASSPQPPLLPSPPIYWMNLPSTTMTVPWLKPVQTARG